jgi:hypothetical protein
MAEGQTGTFESLPLPTTDTYYVNYTMPGKDVGYNVAGVHYPCIYDTVFGGIWESGFAYSNKTDSVTSGYKNQYSAKAGRGASGSAKYLVANGQVNYIKRLTGYPGFMGFDVTNTTYAYNSMKNGDAFSKKFGGPSGNDSDWFKLTVRGYDTHNSHPSDSVIVYLADYRFANNAQDYIVKDWQSVSLSLTKFGYADSVTFTLSSSDTGAFGINTPLFFCLDNVRYYEEGVQNIPFENIATLSPNPATNYIQLDIKDASIQSATIIDVTGRTIVTVPATLQRLVLNTSALPAGQYLLKLEGAKGTSTTRFIKQ